MPTRLIQSLRAAICMASPEVKAATVSDLIPLSQAISGSLDVTQAKSASPAFSAAIAKGPPWTHFML